MQKQQKLLKMDPQPDPRDLIDQLPKRGLLPNSELMVLFTDFNEKIHKALAFARRCGSLQCGLEQIQTLLRTEEPGLIHSMRNNLNVVSQECSQNFVDTASRPSRMLIMSCDGSERFYRHCESLILKYSHRLVGLKLNSASSVLGGAFFGKEKSVKAVLVTRKESVIKVFSALTDLPKTE